MSIFKRNKKILSGRKNDKDVFIESYDQHVDKIYRFVYFKIGQEDEARDLTSSVFLKTWNYIKEKGVEEKGLKALIYKIARNSVIDHYRKNSGKFEEVSIDDDEKKIEITDNKINIEEKIDEKIDLEIVGKKLFELKDEYREIIIMRFIEELSIGEIAEILDKPKGSVRVAIHRALKTLKELMEK